MQVILIASRFHSYARGHRIWELLGNEDMVCDEAEPLEHKTVEASTLLRLSNGAIVPKDKVAYTLDMLAELSPDILDGSADV